MVPAYITNEPSSGSKYIHVPSKNRTAANYRLAPHYFDVFSCKKTKIKLKLHDRESCCCQHTDGPFKILSLDKYVIRIECRNSNDTDLILREDTRQL